MDIEEYERRFVAAFKDSVAEWLLRDDGVIVGDVRFETSGEKTSLVVLFRHKDRPDCHFGYRGLTLFGADLPTEDPEYVAGEVEIVFQEDVQPGYLLGAECGSGGVVWFNAWEPPATSK